MWDPAVLSRAASIPRRCEQDEDDGVGGTAGELATELAEAPVCQPQPAGSVPRTGDQWGEEPSAQGALAPSIFTQLIAWSPQTRSAGVFCRAVQSRKPGRTAKGGLKRAPWEEAGPSTWDASPCSPPTAGQINTQLKNSRHTDGKGPPALGKGTKQSRQPRLQCVLCQQGLST